MNRNKIFLILSILWMGVIFYMSHQPATVSAAQSGGFIEMLKTTPIIGVLLSTLLNSPVAEFVIRKAAHMFSYCVLAILLFMTIDNKNKFIGKTTIISLIITIIYACSDEIHQLFIIGRSGEIRDVMVDSMGAMIGLLLINIIISIINSRKKKV